jgi:hypothetical protein
MTNLAIAHPRAMFRLVRKGRESLSLPTAKDLLERLAQLYSVGKAKGDATGGLRVRSLQGFRLRGVAEHH